MNSAPDDQDERSSDQRIVWSSYFTRPLLTVLFLGFSSGLPFALTGATLAYWLSETGVDKTAIGLFGAVATPYALKFLWAPMMDSLPVPLLTRVFGRRRGWILLTQTALAVAIEWLAFSQPYIDPWMTALAAVLVAFASASQDIVIDAYRVERLTSETQGQGAAMAQLGYQLGMIVAGAGAFSLDKRLGWQATYCTMALLVNIGIITTLLCKEPVAPGDVTFREHSFLPWFRASVIAPFADFMRHPNWMMIVVFIVVYKFADAFLGRMVSTFLRETHFDKDDIAAIVKFYGTIATITGVFVGGTLTRRYGALRVMFLAGVLHAFTNLLYVQQARLGANTHFLAFSMSVENFTGGISSAAFVAYLSNLTNIHYTGTQYALLSSLAALGRTWFATPAGWVEKHVGWEWFFFLSSLLAIPGLVLLIVLNKRLKATSPQGAGT